MPTSQSIGYLAAGRAALCVIFLLFLIEEPCAEAQNAGVRSIQFNRDVRPILSDKCFACHGPDKANRKTDMRLDTEEGIKAVLAGGEQVVAPGQPDRSELIHRVTASDEMRRMPPAYLGYPKLTDAEITTLRRWVEEGAQWQKHWAFLTPTRPALPAVGKRDWPRSPIDYFVLARLEREGLAPSNEADRATLIRRVTLDLTGLPPTPAQVEAFLQDQSETAYEKLVDRLLQSPRYGERMAIRWLEAARYADTNGYQSDGVRSMWRWRDWVIDAFNQNKPFDQFTIEQLAGDLLPHASRDQVIATAFNRNHRTNAEGGIVDEEFRVEYVADRVETTSTVWLGLTVGCARCHDHKYDPITQKEFYRLFAYFNNVPERGFVFNFGNEEPYIKAPTPQQQAVLNDLDRQIAEAERQYAALQPQLTRAQKNWEQSLRESAPVDWTVRDGLILHYPLDGLLAAGCHSGRPVAQGTPDCTLPFVPGKVGQAASFDGTRFLDAGDVANFNFEDAFSLAAWIFPTSLDGAIISRVEDVAQGEGYGLYLKEGKVRLHITKRWTDLGMRLETETPVRLDTWQHVLVTYDGKRKAAGVRIYLNGEPQPIKVLFDQNLWPIETKNPFRIGAGEGPKNRFNGSIDEVRIFDRALTREEAGVVALLDSVSEISAIPEEKRTSAQTSKLAFCFLDRFASSKIQEMRCRLRDLREDRRRVYEAIPTVMVMEDRPGIRKTFVLKRGAYDAHAEEVLPGVPGVLSPLRSDEKNDRLALARWLVDPQHPLTSRVAVNRFWEMVFGMGLVKTVDDFGSQGDWPIHQELLDWLATEFVRTGWNVKSLLKTLVTSSTYRQSSKVSPDLHERDPDNRLLARGPRFRLPPEMIRDQALAVAGLLVEGVGGPSVKPYQPPGLWEELSFGNLRYEHEKGQNLYRRSLYTYWKRTIAPPSMITFDSTDRETCTVRTKRTNTPLQALNLMNDVTYLEASRHLAERMIREGGLAEQARVDYGFGLATARLPSAQERQILCNVYRDFRLRYERDSAAALGLLEAGESPRDKTLDPRELAAWTTVASVILNLDETITKE
ncbi:MAG: DUF1553 domain-containing protein [Acidobacteriota bacterium]